VSNEEQIVGGVPAIDIMRTVFPVIALHHEQDGELARPDFFGAAFFGCAWRVHDRRSRRGRGGVAQAVRNCRPIE
jgi:hypothetical protein